METVETIYLQKTKELRQERKEIKDELAKFEKNFNKLFIHVKYDKFFIKEYMKIDVFGLTPNTRVKYRNFSNANVNAKQEKFSNIIKSLIVLLRRREYLMFRLGELKLLLNNKALFNFIVAEFFFEFSNSLLRGIPLNLGKGLHFRVNVAEVDNEDGIRRVNHELTKKKRDELLSEGRVPQNLLMGVEGEHWIIFHNNKVRLSAIKFSKTMCSIQNFRYYKFIPTQYNNREGLKYDDFDIKDIEDVLKLRISNRIKLRLIDRHLPEFRDENYREYIKIKNLDHA